jgi:hypothetical protein
VTEVFMGLIDAEILVNFTNRINPSVVTKSLYNRSTPCGQPYVFSDDGTYEASSGEGESGVGVICSPSAHKAVSHFPGQAEALNRDYVITVVSEPPNDFTPEVIDWHTGKILWRGTSSSLYPSISPEFEPGSSGIAFSVLTDANPSQSEIAQGWLIRPGKRPRLLSSAVTPTIS